MPQELLCGWIRCPKCSGCSSRSSHCAFTGRTVMSRSSKAARRSGLPAPTTKSRIEKIIGQEFLTIYLNECSQIPYSTVLTVLTRLAQTHPEVMQKSVLRSQPGRHAPLYEHAVRARPGSADADPDPHG